jgi:hypothetical protein
MSSPAAPLSDQQVLFLNYCEQQWVLHGALPSFDKASYAFDFASEDFIQKCWDSETFRKALLARGITPPPSTLEPQYEGVLTGRQIAAIRAVYDIHDNRSDRKKLQDLKVSTQEWNGWKKDPNFGKVIAQLTEALFSDNIDEVYRAIVDQARGGDMSAAKLVLEITGRWSPRQGDVDVARIVQVFIESVSRHVADISVIEAIASDLQAITGTLGATVGQSAVKSSVIRGELAS